MTYQIINLKNAVKQEPETGFRLCRVIAKKGKVGDRMMESQGCILPATRLNTLQVLLADTVGKDWLCGKVDEVVDSLVRKAVEQGKHNIFDDQISVGAILAAMAVQESATRFSKESIGAWFDADIAPLLREAILQKVTGISEDKLDHLIKGYREDFQTLAAREVFMAPEMKAKLQKALNLLPDDYESEYSLTAEKVFEKFAAAGTKAKVEDVL